MRPKFNFFWLAFFWFFCAPAAAELPKPEFSLNVEGEAFVDYELYGKFWNVGQANFSYRVDDSIGLENALGDGIYPSRTLESDADFRKFKAEHPKIDIWHYAWGPVTAKERLYAWASFQSFDNRISEGVKLFFMGEALRNAGLLHQALKAYHALIVHFPKTVVWSSDETFYWYAAPEAVSRIHKICAAHPELGLSYEGGFVDVERLAEKDPSRDKVRVWPGRFVKQAPLAIDRPLFKITEERGKGRVRVVKYNDRYWELLVDGKPFMVKGFTYMIATVGESAHAKNLRPWMTLDDDGNGQNDPMFDSWVDANKNNRQDPDEPAVGDAVLLRRMGANALRIYHGVDNTVRYRPDDYDKELMRRLNRDYGLYFIMGDFLGAYTVGSGADWNLGTDYTDPLQRERMKDSVRDMVMDHKDEPYVLVWLLGNENQHPHSRTNAHEHPEAYAKFLNETAEMIHAIDPDHPVAVCNLNTKGLRELGAHAPAVDIYGANVYSGAYSMGSLWQMVRRHFDRPILFTEMGADAYANGHAPDEEAQSDYFRQNWDDILLNAAGGLGEGNAIGGLQFEWMDEWWKGTQRNSWGNPDDHDAGCDNANAPYNDGCANEEWFGIFGQGNGGESPFLREPRKIYETMKKAWTEENA